MWISCLETDDLFVSCRCIFAAMVIYWYRCLGRDPCRPSCFHSRLLHVCGDICLSHVENGQFGGLWILSEGICHCYGQKTLFQDGIPAEARNINVICVAGNNRIPTHPCTCPSPQGWNFNGTKLFLINQSFLFFVVKIFPFDVIWAAKLEVELLGWRELAMQNKCNCLSSKGVSFPSA